MDNKAILTEIFAETAKGNGKPFVEAIADDTVWTIIGSSSWSRSYSGRADILTNLLSPLSAKLDGANVIVASRIIVSGNIAAVEAKGANRTKAGEAYENSYCWIIRMADGKMAEITEYADTILMDSALGPPKLQGD